jgi:hypothetical protein
MARGRARPRAGDPFAGARPWRLACIAGVTAATIAVGGAFTAIVLGLAAQQTLGSLFAGIVLQSTRPFRVGERVRLVGGALAGSLEGTVSSLGLFPSPLLARGEPAPGRGAVALLNSSADPLPAQRYARGS